MNHDEPSAFQRNLERHLSERFGDDQMQMMHAQRHIVLDRLLARMVAAVPGPWVLGGDFALALRFPERPRTPWVLDVEWPTNRVAVAGEAVAQIMEHRAEDHFQFQIDQSGQGVVGRRAWENFNVEAWLGQCHFSTASLTLNFNYGTLPSERLLTDNPLSFAGIDPVEVEVMPLEIQAAELLRDHVRACKSGLNPARIDDLHDLCLIAARSGLDATVLHEAVAGIYARNESSPPDGVPDLFEGWAEPMRKMAATAGSPDDFIPGYDGIAALFDPILAGVVEEGAWDATSRTWRDPGSDEDEDWHLPAT